MMRYVAYTALLLSQPAIPYQACGPCNTIECQNKQALQELATRLQKYYKQLPAKRSKPPIPQLAPKLHKAWIDYKLHPEVIMRVIAVESQFDVRAINEGTHDFGLMQINAATAKSMSINKNCLMHWQCNLAIGLQVLAEARRTGHICRYNVGTGALVGGRATRCTAYLRKLNAIKL